MGTIIKSNGTYPGFNFGFDDFLLKDFFDDHMLEPLQSKLNPPTNIYETDNSYVLELAVPGMNKKDISVKVTDDQLHISGSHEQESSNGTNDYRAQEFYYQSFDRTFALPKDWINIDSINANMENGVLKVVMDKNPNVESKDTKVIEVK